MKTALIITAGVLAVVGLRAVILAYTSRCTVTPPTIVFSSEDFPLTPEEMAAANAEDDLILWERQFNTP